MKRFATALVLMALCIGSVVAQDDEPDLFAQKSEDEGMDMFLGFKKPYVAPVGGYSMWSLENTADIEPGFAAGVTLGFEGSRPVGLTSGITRTQASGLYFLFHTKGTASASTFAAQAIRFGFSSKEAYGYVFNEGEMPGVYFGATKAPLSWYSVSVDQPTGDVGVIPGTAALARFPDALRFGESSTANVDFRVAGPVAISLNYEWAQVYERHMFWYWGLSSLIEGAADGLAGWFVRAVGKSSPTALPIMHFLLRNGVAMGFKALRMNQMNWPFTTVAPINIMTYSVGVNVVF